MAPVVVAVVAVAVVVMVVGVSVASALCGTYTRRQPPLNRRRYLQAKASNKGEVVLESARLQCGGRPWYALNYYNKLYLTWFNLIGAL